MIKQNLEQKHTITISQANFRGACACCVPAWISHRIFKFILLSNLQKYNYVTGITGILSSLDFWYFLVISLLSNCKDHSRSERICVVMLIELIIVLHCYSYHPGADTHRSIVCKHHHPGIIYTVHTKWGLFSKCLHTASSC